MRVVDPTPRVQIVVDAPRNLEAPGLHTLHGEPVWRQIGTTPRENPDCDGARRVLLLGSSILWGVGLPAEQTVGPRLQATLNATDGPGRWCVHNHAQPAFTSAGKWAVGRDAIDALQPDVVIWEAWMNDAGGFTRLGDAAYNLTGVPTDDAGYPTPIVPMPGALHHGLFHLSEAWRYATLASVRPTRDGREAAWRHLTDHTLPAARDAVEAHGGTLIVVYAPRLDRPFAQSVQEHATEVQGYRHVRGWVERSGTVAYDLAEALAGRDPEDVRLDPCCHYDAGGHEVLARTLSPWVRAHAPPAGSPPAR